jgi:hypothetical protein
MKRSSIKRKERSLRVYSVVKHLSSIDKAPGSTPSTAKTNKQRNSNNNKREENS